MTNLTSEQARRARKRFDSYRERAEKHEDLYKSGKVNESLTSFFAGLAGKYEKAGILATQFSTIEEAKKYFASAGEKYLQSARAYDENLEVLSSLSLFKGVFTSTISGNVEVSQTCATLIYNLHDNHNLEPSDEYADRFYLAGCLADAISGANNPENVELLREINETKPEVEALYGKAIIELNRGIFTNDLDRVNRSVQLMVEYHEEQLHSDNVVDLIMALEATALAIIARRNGYELTVESEYIPTNLVESSAET